MVRTSNDLGIRRRRGVILVVVLALLTLFAIVGLSFALYASSAAISSRSFREAESESLPDVDPELLFSYFAGQLVYDMPDDEKGIYSCLRGHSLARNMYGLNYDKKAGLPIQYNDSDGLPLNQVPFNGSGRLHTKLGVGLLDAPGSFNNPFKADDYKLINYTYFKQDSFLRDPERFGALIVKGRLSAYRPYRTDPKYEAELPGYYVGGFNATYTYPDLNNMFLAAVKAGSGHLPKVGKVAGGTVLIPSFYRPWVFRDSALKGKVGTFDRTNPNWTNKVGKYLLLRPRPFDQKRNPEDPEQFPYPEDEGGDVKNLVGAPGYYDPYTGRLQNNDSIWLDLDFPVMVTADGRKFKALFAPLILDLDNRVNLNVHGNVRGAGRAEHASNQGWGAWEVNVGRVLDASPAEWQSLFQTASGPTGRYGRDDHPHSALPPLAGAYPKVYAPVDFDGSNQDTLPVGQPSAPLALPGVGPTAVPYQSFPDPPAGYSYGSKLETERIGHPNLYNPFAPALPDRAFALSNLEALLRYADTGSAALTSEIFRACPQNFADGLDPVAAARRRGLVTLRSFDLDRPGITPWFWAGANGVGYNGCPLPTSDGVPFPRGNPIASPPFPPFKPGLDSDFGSDWRAAARLSGLRRLDLNRYLPDYPQPIDGVIVDLEQFEVAQRARQYMAAEIFEILWRVTGTGDPSEILSPPIAGQSLYARWNAMRALAQLAVNIVDFIDSDDYMTPFMWHKTGQWVFGTELPRLVLNEAYVQYVNNPNDPQHKFYNINVWVELLNPLLSSNPMLGNPSSFDEGQVDLANGDFSVYEIVLGKDATRLRLPENVMGEEASLKTPAQQDAIVRFTAPKAIPPVSKNYWGNGFFVVGPQYDFDIETPAGTPDFLLENPKLPADLLSPQMTAQVPAGAVAPVTILLKRLACPNLPPQPDQAKPLYNPYITVDYMDHVPANNVLTFAPRTGHEYPLPVYLRVANGRMQPYVGHKAMLAPQSPQASHPTQPRHTFGRHNGVESDNPKMPNQTLKLPFDWLVHLDRKLVSPMELLHVSAFKPHELTQEFMNNPTFHHRAPWFDEDLPIPLAPNAQSHRLYRALEFLGTHNQTVGMMAASIKADGSILRPASASDLTRTFTAQRLGTTATGGSWEIVEGSSLIIDKGNANEEVVRVKRIVNTILPNRAIFEAEFIRGHAEGFTITPTTISERIPGKININTIWDQKVLMALCDPQLSNAFTEAQLGNVFKLLRDKRSPHGIPSEDDKPFRSLATGLYPLDEPQFAGSSMDNTVLQRAAGDGVRQRLFEVHTGSPHPYLKYQLLNKIFNNVTVRSNVFAVWLTAGFFEVTDDGSQPVKLGAEIGRAENRHVRHRMFAIVDRSVLQNNPGPQSHFDPRATPSPGSATGMVVPYFSIIE
jgi:hypothetical protein